MTAEGGRDEGAVGTRDDDDEEALSWGPASADRSYVEGPEVAGPAGLRSDDEPEDELPEGVMSSTMLVVHGVFGGVFLLFTVAWLKSLSGIQPDLVGPLAQMMWTIGTWLAVASPVLWFVGTILLVPTRASRVRLVSFVVGAVLVLPWPFVIGFLS